MAVDDPDSFIIPNDWGDELHFQIFIEDELTPENDPHWFADQGIPEQKRADND